MKQLTTLAIIFMALMFAGSTFGQNNPNPATRETNKEASAQGVGSVQAAPEEWFKEMLTDAYLSGRWAPLKDGQLGEEKTGDKYNIVSVTKATGDNWIVRAKLKYRDQEFVMPIPVQVKFAGDTAILVVDKLAIPGGSTYSARVMFYAGTYSGAWFGERNAGMLYGVITNEKRNDSPSAGANPTPGTEGNP